MACLNGRWHSSQCLFVVDDKGEKKKKRCSKCKSVHGNIRKDRFPQLFQTADESSNDQTNNILSETAAAAAASVSSTNSSTSNIDTDDAAQPTTTATIYDLILSDEEGVCKRILELLSSDLIEENDGDLSHTAEHAAVANCLRIKGENFHVYHIEGTDSRRY